MILKGSEVVTDTYNGKHFFQLVTNSQKYYQIESFNGRRDIMISTEIHRQFPIWVGDHAERTIMYHWKNLYAIRMELCDNEVLL